MTNLKTGKTPLSIAVAAIILLIVMGTRATLGLFVLPVSLSHGWEREVFSLAFGIQNIVWGLMAILAGMLADRWGSARTIALSALCYLIGWLGMWAFSSQGAFYIFVGVFMGVGQAGTTFSVLMPLIARLVPPESRSVVMGVAGAGGSLGLFLMPPLTQLMLDSLRWQDVILYLCIVIALVMPMSALLRRPHTASQSTTEHSNGSLKSACTQALSHLSFHLLFWSYAVCGFHTAFITLHLPAYVQTQQMTAHHGTMAIALIGLFNVVGSYLAGKMGGKISKKKLLAGIYALRTFFLLALVLLPAQPWVLYVFAAGMGFLWLSTVPLTNGLVGQIYGMKFAATLSGIVFLGHQIGSFLGAYMGGKFFVWFASYDPVWWLSIGLTIVASMLCLPIKESPLRQTT